MNTVKEFIALCDERLKLLGLNRAELFRRANLSETLFIMALKRNTHLKVENIEAISNVLGMPMAELLGLEKMQIPKDIKAMEDLLIKIPEQKRKFILITIKNYCVETSE